ncbi:MAG: M15 family metallopeptidase [Acidobacteriota bacterium]|nr:M15 family metallopeptidase [Acidobacteriota bacterium]
MSARIFNDDVMFLQRFLKSGGLYTASLSGVYDSRTDAAMQVFETEAKNLATLFGALDPRSERNLPSLQLKAQTLARQCLTAIRNDGIDARLISGTRSFAEQDVLFRQGRFGNPGPIVTNARGGQSNHNFGIAWDIGIFRNDGAYLGDSPLYKKAARIALDLHLAGLEWGGNWTRPDQPHYQLATGLPIGQVRDKFERGEPYF